MAFRCSQCPETTDLERAHGGDDGLLHVVRARHAVGGEEVVRDGDEGVLRPALEPVHRTAGDERRELQRPAAELLAHLRAESRTRRRHAPAPSPPVDAGAIDADITHSDIPPNYTRLA